MASVNMEIKKSNAERARLIAADKKVMNEIQNLKTRRIKDMQSIHNKAEKDIIDIAKNAQEEITAIDGGATKLEKKAIADKADADQKMVLANVEKDSQKIVDAHNNDLKELSLKAGYRIDEEVLAIAEVENKKIEKSKKLEAERVSKKTTKSDIFDYFAFFLITPLGMILIEEFTAAGMLIIIGGFTIFPPIQRKIIKYFDWINSSSLGLMSYVLMMAGFVKMLLGLLSQA